jgi:AcrR family transcriptional regulator
VDSSSEEGMPGQGCRQLGPRQVEIAEAVLRIVARDGLDAVSMRTVAAEAGRSLGWVQREFATKDVMLQQTLIHALDLMDERIAGHAARQGESASIRSAIGTIAQEVLPGRPDTIAEQRVWLAFMARASLDPDLADPIRARYLDSHREIAHGIAAAQALGQAEPDLDPQQEARAFVALVDGLTGQVLVGVLTVAEACTILDTHLDRLISHPADDGATCSSAEL